MNGNRIIQLFFYFILLVLIEVFIVNKLQLSIYVVPHVIYLFILLLPAKMNKIYILFLSFVTGIVIDLFLNTNGIQTATILVVGLTRNFILPYFISIDQKENDAIPSLRSMGWKNTFIYVTVMTLVYQICLQSLSYFEFSVIPIIAIKVLFSTVLSVLLILFLELILFGTQKK